MSHHHHHLSTSLALVSHDNSFVNRITSAAAAAPKTVTSRSVTKNALANKTDKKKNKESEEGTQEGRERERRVTRG